MSNQVNFPQIFPMPVTAQLFDSYVNQIRLGATISDFTIICGISEDNGQGQTVVKDKVVVRLAPGTAKLLLLNLQMAISAHEEVIGPINMPHKLAENLEMNKEKIILLYKEQMDGDLVVTGDDIKP